MSVCVCGFSLQHNLMAAPLFVPFCLLFFLRFRSYRVHTHSTFHCGPAWHIPAGTCRALVSNRFAQIVPLTTNLPSMVSECGECAVILGYYSWIVIMVLTHINYNRNVRRSVTLLLPPPPPSSIYPLFIRGNTTQSPWHDTAWKLLAIFSFFFFVHSLFCFFSAFRPNECTIFEYYSRCGRNRHRARTTEKSNRYSWNS